MPIPPLDANTGALLIPDPAPGIQTSGRVFHRGLALVRATLDEVYGSFVEGMANRDHREELWHGWMRLRSEIEPLGLATPTWVGGSFLTTEHAPEDIDVCLIYDATEFARLSDAEQQHFVTCIGDAKRRHKVDAASFASFPLDSPRYILTSNGYNYWTRVYGVDRAGRQVTVLMVSERGIRE